MSEQNNYPRLKLVVVIIEVIIGSFVLANATGLLLNLASGKIVVETDSIRMVIAFILIGGALFIDGMRRGRSWM